MCLIWKPSYYLIQLSRHNQVLTEVLPYGGSNVKNMIANIRTGKRPSRPINPNRNRWLQDLAWDVITTGWSHEPEKRCDLSVIHDAFVRSSQQRVYSGDLNN